MIGVVDLSSAPPRAVSSPPGVLVAHGPLSDGYWLDTATFTLTDQPCTYRRVITVDSVPETLAELTWRCEHWPQASAVCDDVLRCVDPDGAERVENTLRIRFNRPQRHNAFTTDTRAALLEALTVAQLDESVTG